MDYSKISKALYILINLTWVGFVLSSFFYFLFIGEIPLNGTTILTFIAILSMCALQVYGYLKLREGKFEIPLLAISSLAIIIDLGGIMQFNSLLVNIYFLFNIESGLELSLSFFDGPRANYNLSFSDISFKQFGFNCIAYVQAFFLIGQDSFKIRV